MTGKEGKMADPALPPPKLHFVNASGGTFEEQRAAVHKTALYPMGDARLIWVNEGDLTILQMSGIAIAVGESR